VTRNDKPVCLTQREFQLLRHLIDTGRKPCLS
jgi:hypothetical protein